MVHHHRLHGRLQRGPSDQYAVSQFHHHGADRARLHRRHLPHRRVCAIHYPQPAHQKSWRQEHKTQIDHLTDHGIVYGFGLSARRWPNTAGAEHRRLRHSREATRSGSIRRAAGLSLPARRRRQRDGAPRRRRRCAPIFWFPRCLPTRSMSSLLLSARALNPEPARSSPAARRPAPRKSCCRPAPTRWYCRPISAPSGWPIMILFEESDPLDRQPRAHPRLPACAAHLRYRARSGHGGPAQRRHPDDVCCDQTPGPRRLLRVQINRRDGDVHTNPPPDAVVREGDGVVVIGRPAAARPRRLVRAAPPAGVRG